MNTIKKHNDNLNFRINRDFLNSIKKRAEKLDIEVSTYIRTLIHLDIGYHFFEVITKQIGIEKEMLKKFDNKILLGKNKEVIKAESGKKKVSS